MARRAKRKKGVPDQPRPTQQPSPATDFPSRLGPIYLCVVAFLAGESVMVVG